MTLSRQKAKSPLGSKSPSAASATTITLETSTTDKLSEGHESVSDIEPSSSSVRVITLQGGQILG